MLFYYIIYEGSLRHLIQLTDSLNFRDLLVYNYIEFLFGLDA